MRSAAAALTLALVGLALPVSADAPVVAADVSTTEAVLGQPVTFTDATTGDGGPFTAAWTDSNGRTVVGHSVTMRFDFAGVHTIGLQVSNAQGIVGSIEIPILVRAPLMEGRAYALAADGSTRADTGEVSTNGQLEERASEGEVANGALRAAALDAEVIALMDAQGARAVSRGDAALVHIPIPIGFIHVTGAEAEVIAGCTMGWRFSDVGKVRLNDAPIVPPGEVEPNTRVDLPGGGSIILNAQDEPAPGRFAVTAVRVLLPGEAPIEVAHAEAAVSYCPWS